MTQNAVYYLGKKVDNKRQQIAGNKKQATCLLFISIWTVNLIRNQRSVFANRPTSAPQKPCHPISPGSHLVADRQASDAPALHGQCRHCELCVFVYQYGCSRWLLPVPGQHLVKLVVAALQSAALEMLFSWLRATALAPSLTGQPAPSL